MPLTTLLHLQEIDLKIEGCRECEATIPKQKEKYDIHRERLDAELLESEDRCKRRILEQHECEIDIEQKQSQIAKYETQLVAIRKNEEYQALLHEIDTLKKQIGLKEERIITLMVEGDEAKAQFEEDKKRIHEEKVAIDGECKAIDEELAAAVAERKVLEAEREPLVAGVERPLLARYARVRKSLKVGAAVVPIHGEACTGCHMMLTAQVVNEILAGTKVHTCHHCGRLLYHTPNYSGNVASVVEGD